jgi:hypothetical protein
MGDEEIGTTWLNPLYIAVQHQDSLSSSSESSKGSLPVNAKALLMMLKGKPRWKTLKNEPAFLPDAEFIAKNS